MRFLFNCGLWRYIFLVCFFSPFAAGRHTSPGTHHSFSAFIHTKYVNEALIVVIAPMCKQENTFSTKLLDGEMATVVDAAEVTIAPPIFHKLVKNGSRMRHCMFSKLRMAYASPAMASNRGIRRRCVKGNGAKLCRSL